MSGNLLQYGIYPVYLAVAVFVIWRQMTARRIKGMPRMLILPLILLADGIYNFVFLVYVLPHLGHHATQPAGPSARTQLGMYLLVAAELVVSAGAGLIRGAVSRVWVAAPGQAMQRGTLATLVVWLALIALRLGASALFHSGAAATGELLISLAVTLLAQNLVADARGRAALRAGCAPAVAAGVER